MELKSILKRFQLPWWQWLGYGGFACLIIFMVVPNSYYRMVAVPWIFAWQIGFLCLGIALLGALRQFNQPFRPLGYGLDWAVLAVAIACLLSTLLAPFRGVALWQLVTISGYGVTLYASRNFLGRGGWQWQSLQLFLVLLSFGMSLWSIFGAITLRLFERNLFPLGHHNFIGAYFCLVLPLLFSFAQTIQQPVKRIAATLLLCCPTLVAIYFSTSRGAFVGLFLWAIATIVFVIVRSKGKKRLIYGSVAAGILTLFLVIALQNPRVQRVIKIDSSQSLPTVQFQVDGQTEDRLFMWRAGLNMLRDRPLTGVGLGNMSRVYNLYRPMILGAGPAHIQQLHGTPPQLLAELGLIGGAAIAFLLFQLIRLGWQIQKQTDNPKIRRLVYGLGGVWLAYGGATLTDYQLENISISLTLLLTVVLLIALADVTLGDRQPSPLTVTQRRLFSITSLGGLFAALLTAIPITWAMTLFASGRQAWEQGQNEKAFLDMATASAIARWNPNYALYLGFWFLDNRMAQQDNPEAFQKSTELAVDYLLKALEAAPNDVYFNQNVGVILFELDPIAAQYYLERSIQLLPRDPISSKYLLLGLSHLQQGHEEQAIAALALQCLISPNQMTLGNWDQAPLRDYRQAVVERCNELHRILIERLEPDDPLILSIKEQVARLNWWHGLPVPYLEELENFSTITQALIWSDRQPDKTLALIEAALAADPQASQWSILRAYFDASAPLALRYKEQSGQIITYELRQPPEPRTLQTWLRQLPAPPIPPTDRFASELIYRSQNFTGVDGILHPAFLERFRLISFMEVDYRFPRTLPPLELLIDDINRTELGLPHPSQNGFTLINSDIPRHNK